MTEPAPFDEHAERLKIRSAPRPVARINRKVLAAGAALAALGLFAAASIALKPPVASGTAERRELYNTSSLRAPEGLSALPASYDALPAPAPPTRLGPPLPGDLGGSIVQAERARGLIPEDAGREDFEFRPSPEDDAARARRMQAAALADEAARAPVFFRMQSETGGQAMASAASSGSVYPAPYDLSELRALTGLAQAPGTGFGRAADPNLQDRKLAFAAEGPASDIYNPHAVEDPLSPYQVMAGTLIPASLITGINSDLPGVIIAQVTQPVYDTVTGRHLLIPQGSRLLGRYQSEVSFGQDRALVTWDRLIFPDGTSLVIAAPGADAQGYAGVSDRTDHHWRRIFAAAGLATVLGVGAELGASGEGEIERAIRRGTTDTVSQAGQRVVDRTLNIQPTIRVRPGWPVRVIVTRDLVLRPHDRGDAR